jgi:hypothetical protein
MVATSEDYRAAAEGVVAQLREDLRVELNYDQASIEWLDGYINRISTQLDKETFPGLAAVLGAYVGETIIATYGGTWQYFEKLDQWGIQLPDGTGAFPSAKIYKQLENPEFDSILSFFTVLPKLRDRINR